MSLIEYGRNTVDFRTVEVIHRLGQTTLRVTSSNLSGFHVAEIHLTPAEAASLAQQLQGEEA